MNKTGDFLKKAFDKICFYLFCIFFYLTYPLYLKAMKELKKAEDEINKNNI